MSASTIVTLINISTTGAKLRGDELPEVGKEFFLRIGAFETFGTVVWHEGELCGMHFDEPLTPNELELVKRESELTTIAHLTPEELMAAEDWVTGFAR